MLKVKLYRNIILIIATIISVSCKFDDLYYSADLECNIRINVKWEKIDFNLNGASVYVYKSDGSLYKTFPPFANPYIVDLSLPKGEYNIVIHNNTPWEMPNMIFANINNVNDFNITGVEELKSPISLPVINEPTPIAKAHLNNVVVDDRMLDYYPYKPNSLNQVKYREYDVTPENMLSKVDIIVHVKRLKSAAGAPISQLQNISGGIYILNNKVHESEVAQEFVLNNRTFDDGSDTDGYISRTINSFGFHDSPDKKYFLLMNFKLVNGESEPITIDVTNSIEKVDERRYKIVIECELPEVTPSGNNDAGFITDIEEWEDYEEYIPL